MTRKLFSLSMLLIAATFYAQDYKSKLAKATCDCVKNIDFDGGEKEIILSKFGSCAFVASQPYQKEIKRDFGIDVVKDIGNPEKMENFGVQVGIMMLGECSDIFRKVMDKAEVGDASRESKSSSESLISGTISKIEKGNFIVFHLVGDNKVLNKFYWISNIESTIDLPNEYQKLNNKKVNISYYTTEIFDASINDYRNVNIITTLKVD